MLHLYSFAILRQYIFYCRCETTKMRGMTGCKTVFHSPRDSFWLQESSHSQQLLGERNYEVLDSK